MHAACAFPNWDLLQVPLTSNTQELWPLGILLARIKVLEKTDFLDQTAKLKQTCVLQTEFSTHTAQPLQRFI